MKLANCPCCGYPTIAEPAAFEVCPVCFWEDDGQGDGDADAVRGGPNGPLSLTEARANFRAFGASARPEGLPSLSRGGLAAPVSRTV